jgi:hypothetical protein
MKRLLVPFQLASPDSPDAGRRQIPPPACGAALARIVGTALAVAAISLGLLMPVSAQCVMCFRTAAAQQQARAHWMNLGILFLGAPPFLILAGFVAFVFSRDKQCGQPEKPKED